MRYFQICAQKYCFFLKKHSQIVQIYSQIVQKCRFCVFLPVFVAVLKRSGAGQVFEDAVET
jgi:hypothetical protein